MEICFTKIGGAKCKKKKTSCLIKKISYLTKFNLNLLIHVLKYKSLSQTYITMYDIM